MKKIGIGIVALTVMFAAPAFAADMAVKAPMVAPAFNWTGLYAGINGGGGWGRENWIDNSAAAIVPISHDPKGGVFGGQLGFRYQWKQLVLGVEGTWDWAGLRDTALPGAFTEEFKIKSIYSLTGQAGWAWGHWLPYVKGGWAAATTNLNLTGPATASKSQTANGWTIGGGIDYTVWQNLILGVEYDHFNFNYGTFSAPGNPFGIFIVTNTSRLTVDQVVARLSYKFDLR